MMHGLTSLTDLVALDQLPAVLQDYVLYPFITLLMCLLSVFVVLGNLLVVSAIWHENQLHSVTNYLIASLAAADCLVGALVMPFSIISEMIVGSWTFGPTWCDLWHSFDVLASTASIMNLCAISLDRYLAITNPICYPTKMTPKRVALLIVSLWTCSSLISFPAILWWRAVGEGPLQQVSPANQSGPLLHSQRQQYQQQRLIVAGRTPSAFDAVDDAQAAANSAASIVNNGRLPYGAKNVISKLDVDGQQRRQQLQQYEGQSSPSSYHRRLNLSNSDLRAIQFEPPPPSPPDFAGLAQAASEQTAPDFDESGAVQFKCVFTDDTYYLLFSSFVSFYGPLCVMLYAYICIYKAAVQQTRFLKYGSKQVMIGGGNGAGGPDGASKKKRQRHASEHSNQSGGNRLEGSAANSCDNYERQHLVLRVHRGGGAAAAVANNNNKSSAGADSLASRQVVNVGSVKASAGSPSSLSARHMRSALKHSRHKTPPRANELQASLTDDDGDDEEDDESELDRRNDQLVSSSLDQTSTLSETFNGATGSGGGGGGAARVSPPNSSWSSMEANQGQSKRSVTRTSSANRSARINLTLSKRDKMRVESQRFTSSSAPVVHVQDTQLTPTTTASVSDETAPASPVTTTCWTKQQTRPALALNQKLCDNSHENNRSRQASATSQTCGRRDSPDLSSGGAIDGDCSGAGFKFVNALRRSDSRIPPLPASLVPLIMMNSDTSTDSSIVTVVTRSTNAGAARTSVECAKIGQEMAIKLNQNDARAAHVAAAAAANLCGAGQEPRGSDTASTRSSVESTPETTRGGAGAQIRRANQVTINLSFEEAPARRKTVGGATSAAPGKGQILHYDSDKLIQSIVDLTNIHYIDCAAIENNNKNNQRSAAEAAADNPCAEGNGRARLDSSIGAGDHAIGGTHRTRGILSKTLSQGGADQMQVVAVEMRAGHSGLLHQNHTTGAAAGPVGERASTPPSSRAHQARAPKIRSSKQTSAAAAAAAAAVATPDHAVVVAGVPPRQQKSMGRKLTKLAKERKAAKTLGIVVGVFILCWLPFFVVNILVALCGIKCIYKPEILHQVVTWLGWLNSAMNPVIYACWSRDFRRAFRRVLCTWVEFLCYDGTRLARKLKLKKCSGYANAHEIYSSRPASSTQRSGASIEINTGGSGGGGGGGGGGNITSGSVIRTNSNNNSHRGLLSDQ